MGEDQLELGNSQFSTPSRRRRSLSSAQNTKQGQACRLHWQQSTATTTSTTLSRPNITKRILTSRRSTTRPSTEPSKIAERIVGSSRSRRRTTPNIRGRTAKQIIRVGLGLCSLFLLLAMRPDARTRRQRTDLRRSGRRGAKVIERAEPS